MARPLALVEGREAARIVRRQPEFRRAVVVCGAQPTVHGGPDVAGALFGVAARIVSFRDLDPLHMPALGVAGLHAARGLEAFAYRAAAFLRLAERAAELVRHEEVIRPLLPAERLGAPGPFPPGTGGVQCGLKPMYLTSLSSVSKMPV